MSKIRTKQIEDFKQTADVDWNSDIEIPSGLSIQDTFVAKEQIVVDDFTGSVINSSGGTWSVTLSKNVLNNNTDLVSVIINGLETDLVLSATDNVIIIDQYYYDIDALDTFEVRYLSPIYDYLVPGYIDPEYVE